jgi:hypothetical protein
LPALGRGSSACRRRVTIAAFAAFASATVLAIAPWSHAEAPGPPSPVVLDRVVARFIAPETGGVAQPRFVLERPLGFEARLEAMADSPDGIGDGYDERRVRAALDHHVAEDILAALALKLTSGARPEVELSAAPLAALEADLRAALFDRLGGRSRVLSAAATEGIDASEVDDLVHRQALAAWYIDRAVSPILHPSEGQLREVFRTGAHPFRGKPFDQVRAALACWFVGERLRVAESSFLQAARSRVKLVIIEQG